ncbi:hypothetical protein [Ancylobacter oerskovii]|uniref:Uncharacterized protein n=1 Tax=Ancylobacter oerskovii TaxID=459519 RepID=A0ABW4YRE1_9HYPH|nr:hypothetical protein [Ancylobacter oerskovii]MBS7545682.1 hypothetical protein [Ancylobacter oerskovii]
MSRLVSPASLIDLAICAGSCSAFKWAALRSQRDRGASWSLRSDEGEAFAAGGILPGGGAWFVATPAAARHLVAILRAIRSTLDGQPMPIRVEIRTPAGERIARLAGFVPEAGAVWVRHG